MTLVDEGQRKGVIWAGGSRMIHGLLDLHETDVASIMTPRIDLVALNAGTSLHEASEQIMQSGYSRFPVIRETIDDVCGILYTRDLLKCMSDGADVQTQTVDSIVRSAVYVPESQRIDALIDEALGGIDAEGMAAMGPLMGKLKPQLQGRADMGQVSQRVKAKLGA